MGSAPDTAIFDLAQKEGRAVITRDLGFAALAADRPSHQGVLLLRFGGLRSPAIIGGLQAAMESLSATTTDLAGAVVVIEPGRVRTRRLP